MVDASLAAPAIKQEIFLADYCPPQFEIKSTNLTFKLFQTYAEITAISEFSRVSDHQASLCLNGSPHMELLSVAVNGKSLSEGTYTLGPDSLSIKALPAQFELTIVTKVYPHENTRLEGLYYSGGNFCTQCEAEGFRHITYFLDRPDVLTRYHVRIEADKGACPVLLSNGNPDVVGDLPAGRHFAEWDDPHPKPCYLFALVAGDLAVNSDTFVTRSGRMVQLNVFVQADDVRKSHHALLSLKRAMLWDEECYGLEYDLDVYNIVAVADFNMGAMENKGLNIFNTKYVLASTETATDADFDHIEGVIGHEYFHNWTGNRVTCRDWFQLSLKEGLTVFRDQEFSSDMGSRSIKRLDDVRVLRMLQFSEDAGPLAHPIRPEKYIEINNFYTSTVYNKGAEVIRMMHMLIGAEAFRRGMDLYFERFDGQAVTCEDFICAMEDASGKNLKQFRLWYQQAGTPVVRISRRTDGSSTYLTLEQSCPATPGQPSKKANHMPILLGWLDKFGNQLTPTCSRGGIWRDDGCLLELTEPRQTFEFRGLPDGATPSLLRKFSAPVKLFDDFTPNEHALLMQHDVDGFARWEAAQALSSSILMAKLRDEDTSDAEKIYCRAFSSILSDRSEDPALAAELLNLPSEIYIGQQMQRIDAAAIQRVRAQMNDLLAKKNHKGILQRYAELNTTEPYSLEQSEKGRRRLRNILLGFIARLKCGEEILLSHLNNANNMTDRIAALSLIAHNDFSYRNSVLDEFYHTWASDPLVIDKWFAVQANSARSDVLEQVKALANHSAFSLENPNRLRSLVSTFAMLNQAGFHGNDGAGYRFLGEMIIAVDAINPQTAARLVAPLGRWGRMPEASASLMKDTLTWILGSKSISDDVRELCSKSIQ